MLNQNLLLTGDNGYNLTKSLRFRSSASAYLNRTATTPTNAQKGTYSVWVKRGKFTQSTDPNNGDLVGSGESGGYALIQYYGQNLYFGERGSNGYFSTAAVFRDPSSWYHVLCVFDTTLATANDRLQVWVNNVRQTAGSFNVAPTLNSSFKFLNENGQLYNIGAEQSSTTVRNNFDGYMAEINFVDGQALTPSSFGSTNALTGVWQPAKYTGTYGTNGFYLPFTNTTSTTTLGYDFSGNSNNWTTNNLSLTAGSTYDSMTDVPTLTSATTANYATLNPLMFRLSNTPGATLSNGNLTSTHTPSAYGSYVFSTIAGYGAKFYYEAVVTTLIGGVSIGIDGGLGVNSSEAARVVYQNTGGKRVNGVASSYGASYTTGDVIGVAIDLVAGSITFYKNNVSQGVASSAIGTNPYFSFGESDTGNVLNWNFGQRPFAYTPPTGFVALNTYNLPTSTIVKGNTVMDATLYTGNGGTQSVVNAAGFKPDFVWAKGRSYIINHNNYDSVRGVQKLLSSSLTDAEYTGTTGLSSFNSNGFTTGSDSWINQNGSTYVAWQWQAGQGTTSSNTNGSITSTVSVNATAGFSVVTYSIAVAVPSISTFGHGLGVAPNMVILKVRNAVDEWTVYHSALSAPTTSWLTLNTTAAVTGSSSTFSSSSSTFGVRDTRLVGLGGSGNVVAYCWAEITGFSKFGSYTGNGSADGPFIYTGFRPKFVMIKVTSTTSNWFMFDSARNTYNVVDDYLLANSSAAGATATFLDFTSNGFKLRNAGSGTNGSSETYIYMAFAENPFKNALAR